MSKARVKMNSKGAVLVMNSQEVQSELLRRAEAIRDKAETLGSGSYAADVQPGRTRAHAMVKTTDARSIASNAKHNTLLKSLDAGRM